MISKAIVAAVSCLLFLILLTLILTNLLNICCELFQKKLDIKQKVGYKKYIYIQKPSTWWSWCTLNLVCTYLSVVMSLCRFPACHSPAVVRVSSGLPAWPLDAAASHVLNGVNHSSWQMTDSSLAFFSRSRPQEKERSISCLGCGNICPGDSSGKQVVCPYVLCPVNDTRHASLTTLFMLTFMYEFIA